MSDSQKLLRNAIDKHRNGDHAGAEVGYHEHLKNFPGDPSGLHFLGLLRTHQNRNQDAIQLMVAALEADPRYVDAWSNLGVTYLKERDLPRAELCARKALELAPDFANAWANLGLTLRAKNAFDEALVAWGRALELEPAMRNIAISYGHLLYKLDRVPAAVEFYGRWRAAMPDDPIPLHMLAAVGGAQRPARASDGYVRATFDDFADSFDRNLEELGYRAPQLLFDALLHSGVLPPLRKLDVIDLGCGTGLCGSLWRPTARRLVGVDLSPNMLSKAAARAVYDQLNCAELTEWLGASAQLFDVGVAADVFCYFGDLSAAFAGALKVLVPGGSFACSLEATRDETAEPFLLLPHGRYQHNRNYVEEVLIASGFEVLSILSGTLRYERQEPVVGLLVVARRPPVAGA